MFNPSSFEEFLISNGRSLMDFGSAEFGLPRKKSILFAELLTERKILILGIEVWRVYEGGYKIDGFSGWYSNGVDVEISNNDALDFIKSLNLSEGDLLTIQF